MCQLAHLYVDQGRYSDAEPLVRRALAMDQKFLGPDHPRVAEAFGFLGQLHTDQEQFAEAEPLFHKALAILENRLGVEHPDVASLLCNLAELYQKQGRDADAELLVDRSISIMDQAGLAPGDRYQGYVLRAELAWRQNRRSEALADLREALSLAEQHRAHSAGGQHERAQAFGGFSQAFERMVDWQTELGDVNEALSTIERGRARSLLDELGVTGADLEAGLSAIEREQLREREAELKCQVASLEKQIELLALESEQSKEERAEAQRPLLSKLATARAALYEHFRDRRNASTVYRNLLTAGVRPPRLSQVQRTLLSEGALLLIYLLGEESGYVLGIDSDNGVLTRLVVGEGAANILGVESGPLTAHRLSTALINDRGTGIIQQLKEPRPADGVAESLFQLWKILVPEAQRKTLTDGTVKRLMVVPDGQLTLLPFETLVVQSDPEPEFLLDAGPPIHYGPSATVLYNLANRSKATDSGDREPVLTVGDPGYSTVTGAASGDGAADPLDVGSRYGSSGGRFSRLPYSGWESEWVVKVFGKNDMRSVRLTGAAATEANVRDRIPGRQVVHLACHGFADQSYGNFFGALALAPSRRARTDPDNDGFLSLAEIYGLDLKGCELAILSACDTNIGPEQRGEGVWALSRGFLVAGSRRVVASNWLVDDEAAASLVSYYCSVLAKTEKQGGEPDYADALRKAKRWVREQEKWKSPFYWGTFLLMGPN